MWTDGGGADPAYAGLACEVSDGSANGHASLRNDGVAAVVRSQEVVVARAVALGRCAEVLAACAVPQVRLPVHGEKMAPTPSSHGRWRREGILARRGTGACA